MRCVGYVDRLDCSHSRLLVLTFVWCDPFLRWLLLCCWLTSADGGSNVCAPMDLTLVLAIALSVVGNSVNVRALRYRARSGYFWKISRFRSVGRSAVR